MLTSVLSDQQGIRAKAHQKPDEHNRESQSHNVTRK
jgi:hypothetical protein